MRLRRRRVLGALPVVLGAGCRAPTATGPFEGLYSWGFEESVFAPCERDERWWVVDDSALVARHREIADEYEPVFARAYGEVSDWGSYGQGGQYPRQLRVTTVPDGHACDGTRLSNRPAHAGPGPRSLP